MPQQKQKARLSRTQAGFYFLTCRRDVDRPANAAV
jgi:hypothetical protein